MNSKEEEGHDGCPSFVVPFGQWQWEPWHQPQEHALPVPLAAKQGRVTSIGICNCRGLQKVHESKVVSGRGGGGGGYRRIPRKMARIQSEVQQESIISAEDFSLPHLQHTVLLLSTETSSHQEEKVGAIYCEDYDCNHGSGRGGMVEKKRQERIGRRMMRSSGITTVMMMIIMMMMMMTMKIMTPTMSMMSPGDKGE